MREDWIEVKLGEICDLKNGFAFKSKDYVEISETMNFRMSQIRPNGKIDLDHNPKYLPDEYASSYSDYLLENGDIVIAMTDMASDTKIGSSGFMGISTANSNQNPLGATVTALPCRQ
ncbi:MAG: restriction endonuclease subunit S [Pseudanabaena sp. Salubria-1]|nr:restriction endonuclease subunit S [Pseudanabaena sp. Salubria-1]